MSCNSTLEVRLTSDVTRDRGLLEIDVENNQDIDFDIDVDMDFEINVEIDINFKISRFKIQNFKICFVYAKI